MQIGEELCDRFLKGDYQYVLAVHTDKSHIHCHIIFNNTNLYNGLSFTTEHNQGKVSERSWAKLRKISDDICQEHGLSVIEPKGKGVSHFERDMQIQGKSWKDKLRAKIAEVAFYSKDFEDFLRNCTASGIEYVYKPQNKVKLKFRLKDEGQQKFTRADTLGEEFTPERIAEQIEQIQKSQSTLERLSEKKNPEKTSAPPKSDVLTDEEFFAWLSEQKTPEPEPIEIQPSEKKKDMWESIRGMRKADEIITALESVGITSFTEFSGFMWNTSHSDDHTEELSVLKKKIRAVDTLIAKMKQRSEHSAVYKEYQECSALWKQSRFRKKNSDAVDSYEQADKYLREHIKNYYVDGRPPKRSELQKMSADLKSEYETLSKEHNAFLVKKSTAQQYTREVRNYINEKHAHESNEQNRQRRLTQQKKKGTLE